MSTSGSRETLIGMIAAGDVDAAAGFYDGRAPSVREYCVRLCRRELVDEATLAAFVDFRGRATSVPAQTDPDDILWRAARTAVAGRLDVSEARSAVCHATPELLAARMNGELTRSHDSLERHLKRCSTCRDTAERLTAADAALTDAGPGGKPPRAHVGVAWLELVGNEPSDELDALVVPAGPVAAAGNGSRPDEAAPVGETSAPAEAPAPAQDAPPQQPNEPEPTPQQAPPPPPAAQQDARSVRVRTRRGGLLGAAKRLGSSVRPRQ